MAELNLRQSAMASINRLMEKLNAGTLMVMDIGTQRVTLTNLEAHYTRFLDAHMALISAAKDGEIVAHIELGDSVEEKYTAVKAELMTATEAAAAATRVASTDFDATVRSNQLVPRNPACDVRLEKIQIPEFYGEFNKWVRFRDMFEAMVHSQTNLTMAAKYTLLMKALKGDAAQVVAGFLPTDDNYESAWKTLKARYDNDRLIVTSHLNVFLGQSVLERESNVGLRRLVDVTNETTRSLAAMKRPVEHWDDIFVHIILTKLPKASIIAWEMEQKGANLPELNTLLEFLEGRARGLDHMNSSTGEMAKAGTSTNISTKRATTAPRVHTSTGATQRLTRANLLASDRGICYFCNGEHRIARCPTLSALSPADRFAKVKDRNLCYNCLTPGHMTHMEQPVLVIDATPAKNIKAQSVATIKPSTTSNEIRTVGAIGTASNTNNEEAQPVATMNDLPVFNEAIAPVATFVYNGRTTLLATAVVVVQDVKGRSVLARALCDTGSQLTFVTERFMQRVKIKRDKFDMVVAGAGDVRGPTTRGVAILQISSRHDSEFTIQINAFVLAKITAELPSQRIQTDQWEYLQNIQLADPNYGIPGEIDLLLGSDVWGLIVRGGVISGNAGEPHAQNTYLGWVVSGSVDVAHFRVAHTMMVRHNEDLEKALMQFWQHEEPNYVEAVVEPVNECERIYCETVRRQSDGRYIASIPFLPDQPRLGNSHRMAVQQFIRSKQRMHSNPALLEKYVAFMREYLELGHMRLYEGNECEGGHAYYIPHHAVQTTDKFRVVFNASAKSGNGVSLNDTQHIGPTVKDKLADIVMRFRRYSVAMVADVEKIFRQVLIEADQQRWQLIVWREQPSETLQTYQLTTVTYGTRSGPYLAVRTLVQCGRDNIQVIPNEVEQKQTLRSIERDFYVDDYLASVASRSEAIQRAWNVGHVLQQGKMHLRKWQSNDEFVYKAIAGNDDQGKLALPSNPTEVSVLGLHWDSAADVLSFEITLDEKLTRTKQTVLSDISKLYDPTGLLAPVVIKAKIFMQKLWLAGISWDEELPNDMLKEWCVYRRDLFRLASLEIPRHVGMCPTKRMKLHCFCDASKEAYAAAIYVRTENVGSNATVRLLASKTRVAPVRSISIPRLELNGAKLLVKLVHTVRQAIEATAIECFFWTDSTIVLGWLRNLPIRYKPYVANRVSYIQQNTNPSDWRHIPTKKNPADCASRSLTTEQLKAHDLWWNGPEFLKRSDLLEDEEPIATPGEQESIQNEEKAVIVAHIQARKFVLITKRHDGHRINFLDRTNSLSKMKRLMAAVLYGVRVLASSFSTTNVIIKDKGVIFTAQRLQQAMVVLTRMDQQEWFTEELRACHQLTDLPSHSELLSLRPFVDEHGILRRGGRLRRAILSDDQKHPTILARKSRLAYQIVNDMHGETMHGGVSLMLQVIRRTHWIIGGRALVKKFINECITCRLQRAVVAKQLMADLPKCRVNPQKPFSTCGVDYCGPFMIRLGAKRSRTTTKAYVAIFVCTATKAVHIELAEDLSTQAFLDVFTRFSQRRGKIDEILSDNGTNFVGASKQMKEDLKAWHNEFATQQLAQRGIKWTFIPPGAPHQGGLWEAAVKSAKKHLVRVIGRQVMSYPQFYTLLTRVEGCLNSRPLVALYDDPDDKLALTPADFLTGGPIVALPEPSLRQLPTNRIKQWQMVRRWTNDIWRRWQDEYLHTLQKRMKWRKPERNLEIGDVVALRDEGLPPTQWCIGRVIAVDRDAEKLVRVVTTEHVEGATGRKFTRRRPVQKICILMYGDNSEAEASEGAGNVSEN